MLCATCLRELALRAANTDAHEAAIPGCDGLNIRAVRAGGGYGGALKEMVLKLKNSRRPFAVPLASLMLAAAGNDPGYLRADAVCCVPSTRAKVHRRGYNPAELLAKRVAGRLGIAYAPLLGMALRVADQDGLSAAARQHNVVGAFAASPDARPPASVVLVDDVLTTGATAGECAAALLAAGAREVRLLVAARSLLERTPLRHPGHLGCNA